METLPFDPREFSFVLKTSKFTNKIQKYAFSTLQRILFSLIEHFEQILYKKSYVSKLFCTKVAINSLFAKILLKQHFLIIHGTL